MGTSFRESFLLILVLMLFLAVNFYILGLGISKQNRVISSYIGINVASAVNSYILSLRTSRRGARGGDLEKSREPLR